MDKKNISKIIAVLALAAEEAIRKTYRKQRHEKLLNQVRNSLPASTENDLAVPESHIQFSLINDDKYDLSNCQEIEMTDKETNEWKSFISIYGGKGIETAFTLTDTSGLLKCDIPLKDLCRVKNNPDLMRGWEMTDGKISKQASFTEVKTNNIAPLLAYQFMAAVTSQYYQHIISGKLVSIETKLDNILNILEEDDKAQLTVAYKRVIEISKKSSFDIADKAEVSDFSKRVDVIREKYKGLLRKVKLDTTSQWSNQKEAEQRIKALEESKFLNYFEIAIQAESLYFIASVVLMKIAQSIGNDEDVSIFSNRINLDYWTDDIDQFQKIKHEVIKYLELEAKSSYIHKKSIIKMIESQQKQFEDIEKSMQSLQSQFECKTQVFLKVEANGNLKKYIGMK